MSLNFLLGFTGVLSFGHAAYFGLGVYGAGLTIKYLVPSTLAGMAVGVLAGDRWRRRSSGADRASARHLFRDGDDRLRPGVLFHRLPLEQRDRRRRRAVELAAVRRSISASPGSTFSAATTAFYYFVLFFFALARRSHGGDCCARRSAARCWRSAKTSAARAFSAFRSTTTSGCPG